MILKRAVAPAASTPDLLAGRNPIEISSACSKIVGSSTPTVTVTAATATSTSYRKCGSFPAKCANSSPARIFAGDLNGAFANYDDVVFTIRLPFSVCIYDECSQRVNPTSNGILSLSEYRNNGYANGRLPNFGGAAVLVPFWQDLYIFQDESQWMSYTICGDAGTRTVTFDWRISAYQAPEPLYRFSATFYEDKPSRVLLRYHEMSDRGDKATVGIEGKVRGQGKLIGSFTSLNSALISSSCILHVLEQADKDHVWTSALDGPEEQLLRSCSILSPIYAFYSRSSYGAMISCYLLNHLIHFSVLLVLLWQAEVTCSIF
jgi:hypothetical protein